MYFVNYGISLFFSDLVNSQHFDRVYTLNALMPLFLIIQTVKQGSIVRQEICAIMKRSKQCHELPQSVQHTRQSLLQYFIYVTTAGGGHWLPLCIETCTKSSRVSLGSCHWHCGKQKQPAIRGIGTQGRRRWPCVHCQGNGNTLPVVGEWSTVQGASYSTATHLK